MISCSCSYVTTYYFMREKKLENILWMRVFELLIVLVGCKIYGIKEIEASESRKLFAGWWSL